MCIYFLFTPSLIFQSKESIEINAKVEPKSLYYKVGDLIDAQYLYDGSWWEAEIVKILPNVNCKKKSLVDDALLYYVKFEG